MNDSLDLLAEFMDVKEQVEALTSQVRAAAVAAGEGSVPVGVVRAAGHAVCVARGGACGGGASVGIDGFRA